MADTGLGTVADLLGTKHAAEVISAREDEPVRVVVSRLKAHGISQLPVVDAGGALVGAVAEVDLLRYLVTGEHSLDSAVSGLVENDFATVTRESTIEELQGSLKDVRFAVVLDGKRPTDVITKIDLIDYLVRRAS